MSNEWRATASIHVLPTVRCPLPTTVASSRTSAGSREYNVSVDAVHLCAYCRQHPVEHKWSPFCSERCKMLDLAKWLDGDYRVPGERAGIGDQESGIRDRDSGKEGASARRDE